MLIVFNKSEWPTLSRHVIVNTDKAIRFERETKHSDLHPYRVAVYISKGLDPDYSLFFKEETERNRAWAYIASQCSQSNLNSTTTQSSTAPNPMKSVITDLKAFISEHRSMLYTIALILLVDHFFLGGQLTQRIKAIIEKLLGKVEKKVDAIDIPVKAAGQ